MDQLLTMSVFVTVAEEAGFAPAARRLKLSPSTVTRAVSQLETLLGARLFVRTTRSVQLTEAGQRYLTDCRRILPEIEEARRQAAGIHTAPRGKVSITTSALFGRIIINPILFELLELYPGISVATMFTDRLVHLIDEGIDIAIRFGELPDSSLSAVRVGCTHRVLCASPKYLSDFGRPAVPSELAAHNAIDLITMKHGGQWSFMRNGKTLAFKPHSRLEVNSADAAIAAAIAGHGITRVASYMIDTHIKSGHLEIVLNGYEPPAVPVHVVHKELGQTSGRVRAVYDYLVEKLRNEPVLK